MQTIGKYFHNNYMANPDTALLQDAVLFNVLYFFCHRGKQNLHAMTKETFKIQVEYDGTCYIQQQVDEPDKNHREDTRELANQGKMYEIPGKHIKFNKNFKFHFFTESTNFHSVCTKLLRYLSDISTTFAI